VLSSLSVVVDLLFFLAGSAGLGWAVRAWRTGPAEGSPGDASESTPADEARPVPSWGAIGLYTLASLLFFSPALLTPGYQIATDIPYQWRPWSETLVEKVQVKNHLLADPPLQMLPFRDLVRQRLLAGELPLWANELGTGQPLLANAQSAPFAPLHLPLLPLPTLRALTVAAAWQVVLGLLLMHALLRRLRAPPAGAALAAVAYGFSTFSVAWAYYPMGMSAMWVPGVVLGVLRVADRAPRGAAGLVLCGLGLALSGHPETFAHTGLLVGVVATWIAAARWWRSRPWRRVPRSGSPAEPARFLLRLGGLGALTFALAAPFLLPILEAVPWSERAEALALDPRSVQPSGFHARHLVWLVDPAYGGSPREGVWTGPSNFNEHATLYGGLVTLALALSGAIVLRGRILAVMSGGAVALLGAFRLDPVHALLTALPVLGEGAHGRLRLLWIFAVAVAAGLSYERVLGSRTGRATFAGLLAAALGLLIGFGTPPAPWLQVWWLATLAGGMAVLALPWLLPPRPAGLRGPRATVALGAVFPGAVFLGAVLLDLGLLGFRYNPVMPPELDLEPPPALAWIVERQREAMRAPGGPRPFRVLGDEWALFANVPALDGLWNLRGHDPMRPAAAARFVNLATLGDHTPGGSQRHQQVDRGNVAAHSYLAVRYLLTRHRRKPPAPAWQRVYNDQGGRVWENRRVLPLFFLPRTVEVVPREVPDGDLTPETAREALERALEIEDYALRGIVEVPVEAPVGEREVGGIRGWEPPAEQQGAVRLREVTGNRFALDVESATGGVVVSSISYDPGWRVRVAGEAAPLWRANGAFLAFRAPAGSHRVELVYSPNGWRWGLVFWASAVLGLSGVGWARWKGSME